MLGRLRRLCAIGALGGALLAVGFGSAGSVSADIDPVAFQKLGCSNGNLACFYARLGGLPATVPYCDGGGCTYSVVGDFGGGYPYYVVPTDPNVGVVVVPPPPQGTLMPALNH